MTALGPPQINARSSVNQPYAKICHFYPFFCPAQAWLAKTAEDISLVVDFTLAYHNSFNIYA